MRRQLLVNQGKAKIGILLTVALSGCLVWLAFTLFRRPGGNANRQRPAAYELAARQETAPQKLVSEGARNYLETTGDGHALMKALEAERFGLKWQQRHPFQRSTHLVSANEGGGYLGMSHDENLNAWFDAEGVTIRPTVPEKERAKAWHLDMTLKAYGYGAQLPPAPPVMSKKVKGSRIEYERATGAQSANDNRPSTITEWYVNRSAGIEQGFTLGSRPARSADVGVNEPLRLVVAVTGDLRARAAADGQSVELNRGMDGVLSYSKLTAFDARGEKLAARMETNAAGDEIALVVEDGAAQYPIVVDPITATQRAELGAGLGSQQEARFGFAVAIDGNLAVVGAWREDHSGGFDQGATYIFVRSTTWVLESRLITALDSSGSPQCGWAVAVHGNGIVVGCPGFSSSKGFAVHYRRTAPNVFSNHLVNPLIPSVNGDRFGESVGIGAGRTSGTDIIVGAPLTDTPGNTDIGAVNILQYDSAQALISGVQYSSPGTPVNNARFGTSVAIDNGRAVVGRKFGDVRVYERPPAGNYFSLATLVGDTQPVASDFGNRVAISGDTVVVGDPLIDTSGGVDAGVVYVYDLGLVTQPNTVLGGLKLTANDGKAGDLFGERAVAVEGNTIVVGAYANGEGGDPLNGIPDDDRGAVYIFTRNNDGWSQQTKISQNNFQGGEAGDHFGIDVDISGNTVLIGARAASGGSLARAGAAFIYELNCLPPQITNSTPPGNYTSCEASVSTNLFNVSATSFGPSPGYQWRKNGVNISGANSSAFGFPSGVSLADAGTYDVVVSNACGSEIVGPFTLVVSPFNINPTNQSFTPSGGNGSISVTQPPCSWAAVSDASFITITSGASGNANGNILYSVAPNTGGQRTGHINVGFGPAGNPPRVFTITQDGVPPPAAVQLVQTSYSVNESDAVATVNVTRTGDTSGAAAVNYSTSDMAGLQSCTQANTLASERCDYTTSVGTVRFNPGENTKTFSVPIVDDVWVEGNETFTVTLSNPTGVSLGAPASATVTIVDNDLVTPTNNPIFGVEYFIRSLYRDILNRQPDSTGLQNWINTLAPCPNGGFGEPPTSNCDRLHVAAGFFQSDEYLNRGYWAFRFYMVSFNQRPTYAQFIPDMSQVGGPKSPAEEEVAKVAYANAFVQRSAFTARYPGLSGQPLAEALLQTAGLPAGSYNAGGQTNGQILRGIAESQATFNRFLTEGTVSILYFGFQRRDPDATGYQNNVNTLNANPNNLRHMIFIFIYSTEYLNRFGPA